MLTVIWFQLVVLLIARVSVISSQTINSLQNNSTGHMLVPNSTMSRKPHDLEQKKNSSMIQDNSKTKLANNDQVRTIVINSTAAGDLLTASESRQIKSHVAPSNSTVNQTDLIQKQTSRPSKFSGLNLDHQMEHSHETTTTAAPIKLQRPKLSSKSLKFLKLIKDKRKRLLFPSRVNLTASVADQDTNNLPPEEADPLLASPSSSNKRKVMRMLATDETNDSPHLIEKQSEKVTNEDDERPTTTRSSMTIVDDGKKRTKFVQNGPRGGGSNSLPAKLRQKIIEQFIRSGGDPQNIVISDSTITTTSQSKRKTVTTVYKIVPSAKEAADFGAKPLGLKNKWPTQVKNDEDTNMNPPQVPSKEPKQQGKKLKKIMVTRIEVPQSAFFAQDKEQHMMTDDEEDQTIDHKTNKPPGENKSKGNELGEFYKGPHETIFGMGENPHNFSKKQRKAIKSLDELAAKGATDEDDDQGNYKHNGMELNADDLIGDKMKHRQLVSMNKIKGHEDNDNPKEYQEKKITIKLGKSSSKSVAAHHQREEEPHDKKNSSQGEQEDEDSNSEEEDKDSDVSKAPGEADEAQDEEVKKRPAKGQPKRQDKPATTTTTTTTSTTTKRPQVSDKQDSLEQLKRLVAGSRTKSRQPATGEADSGGTKGDVKSTKRAPQSKANLVTSKESRPNSSRASRPPPTSTTTSTTSTTSTTTTTTTSTTTTTQRPRLVAAKLPESSNSSNLRNFRPIDVAAGGAKTQHNIMMLIDFGGNPNEASRQAQPQEPRSGGHFRPENQFDSYSYSASQQQNREPSNVDIGHHWRPLGSSSQSSGTTTGSVDAGRPAGGATPTVAVQIFNQVPSEQATSTPDQSLDTARPGHLQELLSPLNGQFLSSSASELNDGEPPDGVIMLPDVSGEVGAQRQALVANQGAFNPGHMFSSSAIYPTHLLQQQQQQRQQQLVNGNYVAPINEDLYRQQQHQTRAEESYGRGRLSAREVSPPFIFASSHDERAGNHLQLSSDQATKQDDSHETSETRQFGRPPILASESAQTNQLIQQVIDEISRNSATAGDFLHGHTEQPHEAHLAAMSGNHNHNDDDDDELMPSESRNVNTVAGGETTANGTSSSPLANLRRWPRKGADLHLRPSFGAFNRTRFSHVFG